MFEFGASHKQNWISIKRFAWAHFMVHQMPKTCPLSADTKSVSRRPTPIAAAPSSALRLNFRAGIHSPGAPQLKLLTSAFVSTNSQNR
jgi:hypothetical protein